MSSPRQLSFYLTTVSIMLQSVATRTDREWTNLLSSYFGVMGSFIKKVIIYRNTNQLPN